MIRLLRYWYRENSLFRPLTSKCAVEVARELLMIFLDFGAPKILQSDNGREFTAKIITELASMFPELVLVNGRPRHPQSQGSVERANGVMKDKLAAWMRDNSCPNWTLGIRFVQWQMNVCVSEATKKEPYTLMFGKKPSLGLSTEIPVEFLEKIGNGILEEEFLEIVGQGEEGQGGTGEESQGGTGEEGQGEESIISMSLSEVSQSATEMSQSVSEVNQCVSEMTQCVSEVIQCDSDSVEDDEFVIELIQSEFGEGQSEVSQYDSVEEGQSVDEESQGAVSDASDMASCLRAEAAKNLRKQAKRMVSRSVAKLKTIEVGDNVLIPVSEFDRGRGDPANLIGIVLEKGDPSGYKGGYSSR